MMSLRNRKSIPVCRSCHMNEIHAGKYSGTALNKLLSSRTLVDNRVIHVESFVKPGKEYFAKSLEEKGWKEVINNKLQKKRIDIAPRQK
jgi:hypothetical protein